jgi:hypothetical protein
VHGNIQEISKKRIHTLDYLRKAYVPSFFPRMGRLAQ